MKSHILVLLSSLFFCGAVFSGCSSDETYDTEVTRKISLTMDGQPWSIYYGTSNRPLFIYTADGKYVANYSTSYNFSLGSGSYKVFATDQSNLVDIPNPLDDMVIAQDTLMKQTFGISAPVNYSAGQDMSIDMFTRTGVLRLHSTDEKADKSYSVVKATITTPVTGYQIGSASYVVNDEAPLILTHSRSTSSGGINYNDDMVLLGTQPVGRKVNVHLDYLDSNGDVVKSKDFADGFEIVPNDTTVVSFALNNAEEPVIIDYTVALASDEWTEDKVTPGAPLVVPDGYTYVGPNEDISTIVAAQLADDNITAIKLYLKAGETYTLGANDLAALTKPISIVGQTPARNQAKATLSHGAVTPNGNIEQISFKNINFSSPSRFFNVRNQNFNIGTVSFDNCDWNDWSGVIWYQNTSSAALTQHIGTFSLTSCHLANWTYSRNPLLGLPVRNPVQVDKLVLHNNIVEGNNVTAGAIYSNYGNTTIDSQGNNF